MSRPPGSRTSRSSAAPAASRCARMAAGSSYSGARASPDSSSRSTVPALEEQQGQVEPRPQEPRRHPAGIDLRAQHQGDRGVRHLVERVEMTGRRGPDDPDRDPEGRGQADGSRPEQTCADREGGRHSPSLDRSRSPGVRPRGHDGGMTTTTSHLPLRGPYDLREVALMGFGHREEDSFDGVMRLGFCVDGDHESQVGVALRQDGDLLTVTVERSAGPSFDADRVAAQAARVVSADQDGQAYAQLCRADPVLAPIFARAPGSGRRTSTPRTRRPSGRSSAPAAPAQSGHRSPTATRGDVRDGAHGGRAAGAGGADADRGCWRSRQLPGLPADRIPRLHAIAEAAQRGDLAVDRLTALGGGRREVRAAALARHRPVLQRADHGAGVRPDRRAGHRTPGAEAPGGDLRSSGGRGRAAEQLAEGWRPWRTWVTVMLRALGGRPDA